MSAAAARALHPCTRSVAPPRQWPRDRACPTQIKQPEPHGATAVRPGETGTKSFLGRGLPADPKPVLCGHLGQRPGWGGGLRAGQGGGGAAAGPEGNTVKARASRAETSLPPSPDFPLAPSPLPCEWASCQCRRPPTGSRAGAAKRKSISRRQLRPAFTKQPPGRDGERPRLRIRDKVVPCLWRFYSSRPSQSASAPPPGPSWPFPHFGDQPIAARCIMGDVVPERGRGGTCL